MTSAGTQWLNAMAQYSSFTLSKLRYVIIERKKASKKKPNYRSSFIEKDSKKLENQASNTC